MAAEMIEKDTDADTVGKEEASSTGEKPASSGIKLPGFETLSEVVKQRMSKQQEHFNLSWEESGRVAAHLQAFQKSAKMRDAALALYINAQVRIKCSGSAPVEARSYEEHTDIRLTNDSSARRSKTHIGMVAGLG